MKTCNVKIWNGTAKAYADEDGNVRVFDSIAGHYTQCHSLSPSVCTRVRRLTGNQDAIKIVEVPQ